MDHKGCGARSDQQRQNLDPRIRGRKNRLDPSATGCPKAKLTNRAHQKARSPSPPQNPPWSARVFVLKFIVFLNRRTGFHHMIHKGVRIPHFVVVPCKNFYKIATYHASKRKIGDRCIFTSFNV